MIKITFSIITREKIISGYINKTLNSHNFKATLSNFMWNDILIMI